MNSHLSNLIRAIAMVGLVPLAGFAHANERIDERLSRVERVINSGALAEMVNQMEQLRRELQLVRGDLEVVQHELEEVKRRQRDLYQDNDRRLLELETTLREQETGTATAPASAIPVPDLGADDGDTATSGGDTFVFDRDGGPSRGDLLIGDDGIGGDTVAGRAADAADDARGDEWETYQAALNILRAGRFNDAARAFKGLLDEYPDGEYQDNALYWLGESYYAVRDFNTALPFFQRIVDQLPSSGKYPDAMLKVGFIYHEQRDFGRARTMLESVQREYPDSTAAMLAGQRLERIRDAQR